MGALFGDKEVKIDFINHLDQTAFVFEGLDKPIMEMNREELENAYLLMQQLASFWKLQYDNTQKSVDELIAVSKRLIEIKGQ
jgi:hypothetical protein